MKSKNKSIIAVLTGIFLVGILVGVFVDGLWGGIIAGLSFLIVVFEGS